MMCLFNSIVLCLSTLTVSVSTTQVILTPSLSHSDTSFVPNAIARAPDIFNALHSAMRQWGSSLKHNGMSYFPVTVPAGTRLYHGAGTPTPETGLEWLAFEIEHATLFGKLDVNAFKDGPHGDTPPKPPKKYDGYVHNYRTIRPLTNLLYLDGQSSSKSMMGTLDTQDRVLLKHSNFTEGPGTRDSRRARALCDLSPDIEGFLRMEIGFELILCNFTSGLEYLDAVAVEPQSKEVTREELLMSAEYVRGISHRYGGITAGRVVVDYSSMVSAFFYPINLTNPDPEHPSIPRIGLKGDDDTIEDLKKDVLEAFKRRENWQQSIDWQGVADLIVTRYSDLLAYLTTPEIDRQDTLIEIKFLLEHYMDFSNLNLTTARYKCATNYLVPESRLKTSADRLVSQAIFSVSEKICNDLFDVRESLMECDDMKTLLQAKSSIKKLMDWLGWTTWLECGKCKLNEYCLVPIWPFGAKEDYENPRCTSTLLAFNRTGYWDYGS